MNQRFLYRGPFAMLEQLRASWLGSTGGLKRDMPWSGTVTVLLSVSLVVAQRLRKLDFAVKDSEESSATGANKIHFLRPREPREDTGQVSATDTRPDPFPLMGVGVGRAQPAWPGAKAG